ncbi:MAG: arginine--tRNA ligase [Parvibaculales bacterium]
MDVFAVLRQKVLECLTTLQADGLLPGDLDFARVNVEPPREATHGDMATNAAMVLAKPAGLKPRDLAQHLADKLSQDDRIAECAIAGPGFLNLNLKSEVWLEQIRTVLGQGVSYGDSTLGHDDLGNPEKVNIEYVSANPTGPMHVGHARGAVVGDALARLLERAGFDVTREYYINDAGSQVDTLAQSVLLRAREAAGEDIGEIPEGLYPGDYLIPVGQAYLEAFGTGSFSCDTKQQLAQAKQIALPMIMEMIKADLEVLGVHHDVFVSEQSLHDNGSVEKSLTALDAKGLIYEGVLEPPKGKSPPPDWEPQPQTLFKSTEFGDDSDRALKKSDGRWTYFAPDIAYHSDKIRRGFNKMIDVWGADHAGYIKRMQSAIAALSDNQASLDVKVCQMVKLMRGGEPVKMSKRSGSFVTLREVVDEVGKDVVRFMMLTRKNDAPLDFDFLTVKEKSRENPVFYVHYAYARINSVCRNAVRDGVVSEAALQPKALAAANLSTLTHPQELALVRQLAALPRVLESAAAFHEPHRISIYLNELSAEFHALWNMGKEQPGLKFIQEDKDAMTDRLALISAVALALESGLDILGVKPEKEMR